jgi:hypothetical protein
MARKAWVLGTGAPRKRLSATQCELFSEL